MYYKYKWHWGIIGTERQAHMPRYISAPTLEGVISELTGSTLEKYKKMPIFQDKVDKANEVLRKVGLPKVAVKH